MSFVDDLNWKMSDNELAEEEDKAIKVYVSNIISAIKKQCMENRDKNALRGYFCRENGWEYQWEGLRPGAKSAVTYSGIFISEKDDRVSKSLNIDRFIFLLRDEIKKLGFEDFKVKAIPFTNYYKEYNGKSIFGNARYKNIERTDYNIYIELKW